MTSPTATGTPFDAVLCDLDNVIRFYDTSRLTGLERELGLPEGTTAGAAFSPEIVTPLLLGRISRRRWVESIAGALADRLPRERARDLGTALATAPFRADEAVVALLRQASATLPLVLVTNGSVELDDDLALMGLADLTDHVVNSAGVGVAKPDREIYEIAARRAAVPADRCLFVDDRLENVQAAAGLGMTGVHYREPADLRRPLAFLLDR
ncbi:MULTISPECIES: HAD-IA family hydrolase [unclassified Streptomyces]|uniref:HAD-IA family hydrolase n=1 Tax=unclassified Streptomyces TaxID=2593676 RepID=UPI0022B69E20|nr:MULTISPECIES: HAD-IA family hydrolase [unclassified Streptomyces]MCZ7417398.1 HAD-IA family hydrolase [Streptomyces sp. WMMC897]MCZ7432775.1 HAD-IA family hydrolase [Streptomyces sp. WMMC1477]